MTLCVAIHAGDCVHIAADSAVSYESESPGSTGITSTGETEGTYRSVGRLVKEDAWKLFPVGSGIATFSGDMITGHSVIRELVARHETNGESHSPRETLLDTLRILEHMPNARAIEVLVAFDDSRDGPGLVHGVYTEDRVIVGDVPAGELAVIGSRRDLGTVIGSLAWQAIRELDRESFCACLLAALHQIANKEQLMHDAIGGSFTAAYVDGDGRHWQPDIHFSQINSTRDDQPVLIVPFHTMVRDNVLVVGSGHEGKTTTAFPAGESWEDEWRDHLTNYHDLMRFDYHVVADVGTHASHVFEMRKQRASGTFRIWSDGPVARWQILDDGSATCLNIDLETPGGSLVFVDFTNPTDASRSVEDQTIRDIWHHESDPDRRRARIDREVLKPSPNETKFSEET